jgi:hypothetical protein
VDRGRGERTRHVRVKGGQAVGRPDPLQGEMEKRKRTTRSVLKGDEVVPRPDGGE